MKVVLSYSGGLDTSAILLLLRERGYKVVTVTVDVGLDEDLEKVEERAYMLGSHKHYNIDAREEFAYKYISMAVKANALYEEYYPLGTALARPLIAEKVAEIAKAEDADAVAHGCTGKGNDQVRFDSTLMYHLGPGYKIMAPVREMGLTREKSIEILSRHGFKPPGSHGKYSIDENMWTRSIEGGPIDDEWMEPPEDAFLWTKSPEEAPAEPLYLEIGFEEGVPTTLNGEKLKLHDLIERLNTLAGLHGYGRIDHIENRVVGLKSREVYEAPAALTLINAHKDLEKLILTPRELRFKRLLDQEWSDLVYNGLWIEPLRKHIEQAINSINEYITGTVRVKIYKGSLQVVGRRSPYSGYSKTMIDYNKGWYPTGEEAQGFVKIYTMHSINTAWTRYKKGVQDNEATGERLIYT
ncbi:MAG: argininosuccinate synthase [Desulfurococcales archaeon]|nr:argininosuccinate synthase [Desulfurococcales archaeon]